MEEDIDDLNALIATQEGGATPSQTSQLNYLENKWDDLENDIGNFEDDYDNAKDDIRDADC